MTKRGVLLGFGGAALICGLAYLNNYVLRQTYLIGNHFPISVHGTLIIFLAVNIYLYKIARKFALNAKELTLILAITLAACCIPSSGLLRTFTTQISLPHYHTKLLSAWQKHRVVDEVVPECMLIDVNTEIARGEASEVSRQTITLAENTPRQPVDVKVKILSGPGKNQARKVMTYDPETRTATLDDVWRVLPEADCKYKLLKNNEDAVLTPFIQGASKGKDRGIPWAAWKKTLIFWVPVVFLISLASICLSLVVHRQWSDHEHLAYPLANLVNSVLPTDEETPSPMLMTRKFWIAFGIVLAIYLNNYVTRWAPGKWVAIPTHFEFQLLIRSIPGLGRAAHMLVNPTIYLTVIAIAYFLASDVSFSVGIGPYANAVVASVLAAYGISLNAGQYGVSPAPMLTFGAYVGMAIMIAYTGRHYYKHVFRKSFGATSTEEVPKIAVWSTRIFLLASGGLFAMLVTVGVDWPIAILYLAGLFMLLLVMGRIIVETGMFFIQAQWMPCGVIIGLFGFRALSPELVFIMMFISCVFVLDPREALLPFMVNSAKLLDLRKHKLGKSAVLCGAAVVIGLAIALPMTLSQQYKHGVNMNDPWAVRAVPRWALNPVSEIMTRQEATGVLEHTREMSILGRFMHIRPLKPSLVWAVISGIILVVGCSFLRQHLPKFPIHPVMFLLWSLYSTMLFAFSFLLGWVIKLVILKYGGSRTYQKLKPVFIGLVAGELVGLVIPIIFGLIYYWTTGRLPKRFGIPLG